jgi:hypothetical protein
MTKLSSLLVFNDHTIFNSDSQINCDAFGQGKQPPIDAVQLDDMLDHLIETGKLDVPELIAWLQRK